MTIETSGEVKMLHSNLTRLLTSVKLVLDAADIEPDETVLKANVILDDGSIDKARSATVTLAEIMADAEAALSACQVNKVET